MKVIITKNYEEMSDKAFEIMAEVVKNKPDAVLGLATGSTPIGLYKRMIADHNENGTSYKKVHTVNLDEYAGLDYSSDQSYVYFMRDNLFDHIDIDLKNTNIENGKAADRAAECDRYNKLLGTMQQDIQVLGIGSNGHIAFNEPGSSLTSRTRQKTLTTDTIIANSRFFDNDINKVPKTALTVGVGTVLSAKEVMIIVNGHNKARALYHAVEGSITQMWTISALQMHEKGIIVCDDAATEELKVGTYRYFKDIEAGHLDPESLIK